MINLNTEIIKLNRVGLTTAKRLKKLGIENANDLLFHFPFRYDDYSKTKKISELNTGDIVNVIGQIEFIQNKRSPKKRMYITETLISDKSDSLRVIWFNQPFIAKNLKVGDKVSISGKVEEDHLGNLMISPIYEKINNFIIHTKGIIPNYHLTENITQKQIRFLIKNIIHLANDIIDWLPEEIINKNKLLKINEAIYKIHFPKNWQEAEAARKRLAFNELFLLQIQAQIIKNNNNFQKSQPLLYCDKVKKFVDSLPYELTTSQKKATWKIIKDMNNNKPMVRLLEGDVGSGKTIVAVIIAYNVFLNKKKTVVMVPTEILAKQHYNNICKLLTNFNVKICLITSGLKNINYDLNNNGKLKPQSIIDSSDIIIGTHALLQDELNFNNLGLIIIDEQHRFGVEQRKLITEKSNDYFMPHLLSMTATPIPRSLALALYGDLDISILDEMPKGRKKIITKIVSERNRQKAYQFIKNEILKRRQVFVICPLIDYSDKLGVKAVKQEYEKLKNIIFPELSIGILHGKMKIKEKEETMKKFLKNEINIMVSTSVIEVGVDVPNTSVMMIEGADRFGLAQLHQFRGRVGRSEHQSYCILFSESNSPNTIKRLNTLVDCYDGFSLAKMDLNFRGPGEVYGIIQAGFPELKIASLFDYELMLKAKKDAEEIFKIDNYLLKWPILNKKIEELNLINHPE